MIVKCTFCSLQFHRTFALCDVRPQRSPATVMLPIPASPMRAADVPPALTTVPPLAALNNSSAKRPLKETVRPCQLFFVLHDYFRSRLVRSMNFFAKSPRLPSPNDYRHLAWTSLNQQTGSTLKNADHQPVDANDTLALGFCRLTTDAGFMQP